jgi:polyisoprenoid-binding protein YceI
MATAIQTIDGVYELDRTHSTVQFAVRHVGVSSFRGSFGEIDARLVVEDGVARLRADAAVESISIGDPADFREHVVYGSDFFAAEQHPRMTFRSTSIELGDDGALSVEGTLEIRGLERPVHAAGTFTPPTEDPFGNTRLGFALESEVDRRSWGFDWQTALPAGGDALGWDVAITAQLEFVKSR